VTQVEFFAASTQGRRPNRQERDASYPVVRAGWRLCKSRRILSVSVERIEMKVLSSVVAVAAVWGSYHFISQHRAMNQVLASADVNGFVEIPHPVNQEVDTIYVVAAQNCPRAAAQQADQLAKQLGVQGIPVVRTSQVFYQLQQVDASAMSRLTVVMEGPLPLVFVHGRAAMNPELTQVVEEYYRPGIIRPPH
jgi:hypothetical protein